MAEKKLSALLVGTEVYVFKGMVTSMGFSVSTCSSIAEAVTIAQNANPNIIISLKRLPDGDEFNLISALGTQVLQHTAMVFGSKYPTTRPHEFCYRVTSFAKVHTAIESALQNVGIEMPPLVRPV